MTTPSVRDGLAGQRRRRARSLDLGDRGASTGVPGPRACPRRPASGVAGREVGGVVRRVGVRRVARDRRRVRRCRAPGRCRRTRWRSRRSRRGRRRGSRGARSRAQASASPSARGRPCRRVPAHRDRAVDVAGHRRVPPVSAPCASPTSRYAAPAAIDAGQRRRRPGHAAGRARTGPTSRVRSTRRALGLYELDEVAGRTARREFPPPPYTSLIRTVAWCRPRPARRPP